MKQLKDYSDFVDVYQSQSNETQKALCILAFSLKSLSEIELSALTELLDVPGSKTKSMLSELQKLTSYLHIIEFGSHKIYRLYPAYSLLLLHSLIQKELLSIMNNVNLRLLTFDRVSTQHNEQIRNLFASLILKKQKVTLSSECIEYANNASLLTTALQMPEFDGLAHYIPAETLSHIYLTLLFSPAVRIQTKDEIEFLHTKILTHPELKSDQHTLCMDAHAFYQYFLSGKIDKIPENVSCTTTTGLYLHAIYYQINKELSTAIKFYEKGIKLAKTHPEDILPTHPIFNYSYALALCQSENPEILKKIETYFKRKALKERIIFLPAYLLFALKMNKPKENIESALYKVRYQLTQAPLLDLMCSIILCYNGIKDMTKISDIPVSGQLEIENSNWLTMEISSVLPNEKETYKLLEKSLGFPALITQTVKEEDWEKNLNQLIHKQTIVKTEKRSRIAYLINPDLKFIQPILQNSTDGINWSIGRNIALSRLQKGEIPEMTETDLRVSKTIKQYSVGYYGQTEYLLSYENALLQLIGYPAVLMFGTPSVAIEIVAAEPELLITKDWANFYLSTNVPVIDNPIQVIRETDTRLKVLKLDSKQIEILTILNKTQVLPLKAHDKLLQLLSVIHNSIQIHSDLIDTKSESLAKVTANSKVVVQLLPVNNSLKAELFIKPFGSHPPYCKAGVGAKSVLATVEGVKSQAVRNLHQEIENRDIVFNELQQITDSESEKTDTFVFETPELSLEMLERLQALSDIVIVEWPEGVKYKVSHQVSFSHLSVSLKGINNWFELSGELKINDQLVITIQSLLETLRANNAGRFIELQPGQYIALSEQLRKQLNDIDSVVSINKKGNLQLPQFSTSVIEGLSGPGACVKGDTKFKALQKNIQTAQKKEYKIPKQLKAELREYQEEGFKWMARLADWGAGACLADDMGLGKTVQAIAMLLHKAKEGSSLVICPASVLPNWKKELTRFAPSLRLLVLNDTDTASRVELVNNATDYDVVLVTFGLLINEETTVTAKSWSVIAIDEAHTIKNKETKVSKVVMQLQGNFRVLLTGTPIQNHLGEVWNLFTFITPGLLGSFESFTENFITPITQLHDKIKQRRLKQLISPFLLRRTKETVLHELPAKTEIIHEIDLSDEERAYYEVLRRNAERIMLEAKPTERLKVLAEITKLRMAACNVNLVDNELNLKSSKTDAFLQIVEDLTENGHRALVFSQFTSELALLKKVLDKKNIVYLYLDGSTTIPNREKLVKEFQTGAAPVFLISLKAGGLGINLTAADFVIHIDPWWNPAVEDQASDRAHRIGQKRPVTIYRLIAKHTIEEKIIKLHSIKKDLADSLLEGSNLSGQLTQEELVELLKK